MARAGRKKERKFTILMKKKLFAVFGSVLALLIILVVRIAYIDIKSGNKYAKQVLSQENYDSRTLYSRRGEIQDTNGRVLAYSEKLYNVVLDCSAVNYYEDEDDFSERLEASIDALVDCFDLDAETLRDLIQGEETRNSQYRILLQEVTEDQKEAYEEYCDASEESLSDAERKKRSKIVQVWFEETYKRIYPLNSLASTVVGFTNSDGGVTGLENYYDSTLEGTNGRVFGYLNDSQEYQKQTIMPEDGYTLQLTLDINIQEIVEKYIAEFDETYGTDNDDGTAKHGAKNIGVVVMDPNDGSILAMATNSSYDLNNPQDLSAWYTEEELEEMDRSEKVDALNTMWKNFCITDTYEPGSVIKPINVAAALECGAITTDTTFYCDGGEQVTDTYIRCDNIYGHGDETLEDVLKNSCNDGLMAIGRAMTVKRYIEYQSLFNFGKKTGIDLPQESAGIVYDQKAMNEVELATCSFGQGFTCTMVQEAAAFSSVINGGYYYQPHVVEKILDSDGKVVQSNDNMLRKQTVSEEVSDTVRAYTETVVEEGTGKTSAVPGYRTGGKTGTAEKINPETGQRWAGKYLVSFIGTAPITDPQVVIYVIVDEPNVAEQASSTYAQGIFRQIATEVFPYLNIYPTEEVSDAELEAMGLTQDDVVADTFQTFQAYDAYGTLYNDAHVEDDYTIVSGDGTVLEGAYVDADGLVYDGYGNQVSKVTPPDTAEDADAVEAEAVDNPDMALPPSENADGEDTALWEAVKQEEE